MKMKDLMYFIYIKQSECLVSLKFNEVKNLPKYNARKALFNRMCIGEVYCLEII